MKKIISFVLLVCTLTLCLASCGHTHEYGEWETVKEATVEEKGTEIRKCECGETETRDIPKLEAPKTETKSITSIECSNELKAIYDKMLEQKNIISTEEQVYDNYPITYKYICGVCFDGTNYIEYEYQRQATGSGERERWFGYVDGEKVEMIHDITNGTKYYESYSYEIDGVDDEMFEPLDYYIEEIEYLSDVECVKTISDKITYQVKFETKYNSEVHNVTIEVQDGLITKIYDSYYKSTQMFSYDKVITMPSIEEYTFKSN